jgi:predicted nucleic acid-binding Zn ribbon protein
MASPERLYLDLYNAKTNDDLYRLMYAHAGPVTRAATLLRKAFPDWMDAAEQHWRRYKQFVHRWVQDALTKEDWQDFWRWVGTDDQTLRRLAPTSDAPPWSLAAWLIAAMKSNPYEPFSEAYRQIGRRMLAELQGRGLRPRFCTICQQLFEPDRHTQQYCSARCRNLMQQRLFRSRRKQGATADQPTGTVGDGS